MSDEEFRKDMEIAYEVLMDMNKHHGNYRIVVMAMKDVDEDRSQFVMLSNVEKEIMLGMIELIKEAEETNDYLEITSTPGIM